MPRYMVEMDEPTGCVRCQMADDAEYYCHAERDTRHHCGTDSDGLYTEERPDWCPLVEADGDPIYDITYEGRRKDMWYQSGGCFSSLDEAKEEIARIRADYDGWHAFQVVEETAFRRVVHEEE